MHENTKKNEDVSSCLNFSKIADVGIPETPTPLESAKVSNGDTPALKNADVLNGWSLLQIFLRNTKVIFLTT